MKPVTAYRTKLWWLTMPVRVVLWAAIYVFHSALFPNDPEDRRETLKSLWEGR